MLALRRHILPLLLSLLAVLLAAHAFTQIDSTHFLVQKGPLQKKKLHERFIRIVHGGDGYFYVFKSSTGHYWNFTAEGESALQIIRFSQELTPVDTLRIRRIHRPPDLRNVFEVLPSPRGIALLSVARSPYTGMPALTLSEPVYADSGMKLETRILDDMPGFSIGVDNPGLRYAYSADSAWIVLAWRRVCRDYVTDNSLACMILSRDLKVVREPFLPFKTFDESVSLREMHILDPENLLFTAHTIKGGNALQGPATISFGLLHYAVGGGRLSVIGFSKQKEVPVEMKIVTSVPGRLIAAGWYLDQQAEHREAGIFIGDITGADTLENLVRIPMQPELRDALIRREKKSGAVAIRSSYHTELLDSKKGYLFVLHLRGQPNKGIALQSPTVRTNNALHCWFFDPDFRLLSFAVTGFQSGGREEMMETFSWQALQLGEEWYALASDFGNAKHENHPVGAFSAAWRLSGDGVFERVIEEHARRELMVLAPREMVQVGEGQWVGLAVGGRVWRVVRVNVR